MNTADKERLLELKIHVWYQVAHKLIENEDHPYILPGYEIETHKGREDKAIRLLTDAGIITKTGNKVYKVLRFEEAKELATKPIFNINWDQQILGEVHEGITLLNRLNKAGYKAIERFSKTEVLYIYFHKDEFNTIKEKNEHHDNGWDIFYLKELTVLRDKMVLKALVEIELQNNFPQYIQHFVGYDSSLIYPSVKEEFTFKKYAISSVFLNGELEGIFESYTNNTNKANAMNDAFNRTIAWVDSAGGYQEAIKIIRKQIIKDFTENFKRFAVCLYPDDSDRLASVSYSPRFKFINNHKDLFNYETLYFDPAVPALKGEEVLNLNYESNGWHRRDTLEPIDFKEEFDEPEDKGDALEEQAA